MLGKYFNIEVKCSQFLGLLSAIKNNYYLNQDFDEDDIYLLQEASDLVCSAIDGYDFIKTLNSGKRQDSDFFDFVCQSYQYYDQVEGIKEIKTHKDIKSICDRVQVYIKNINRTTINNFELNYIKWFFEILYKSASSLNLQEELDAQRKRETDLFS